MNQKSTPQGLHRLFSQLGKVGMLGLLALALSSAWIASAHAKGGAACSVAITDARGNTLTELEEGQTFYGEVSWVGEKKFNADLGRVDIYSQGDLFGSTAKNSGGSKGGDLWEMITVQSGYYEFNDVVVDDAFMVSVVGKLTRTDGSTVTCSKMLWVH